jgi:isoleucyl-tRNA synthetase
VPITLVTCSDCGTFVYDEELFDRITSLTAERGADVWFELTVEDLLGRDRK